jgi:hypothetical protein
MHFTGQGGHLWYSGCDFIERDEDTLGATSNQVKSWVQVIKMNYFPRWSIWTFRSYNHSQRLLIWILEQGQLIWLVIGHIADSAALTGLTFHPHRSDWSDQSAQNANWTSPLCRSRRDNQNAYVERPVRSPDEGVMVLARTSSAPDRSDWWGPTVWPVIAAKSELGVVFQYHICIGFDSYWGKTSPQYIYEGSWAIEGNTIESIITSTFYLSTPFSNLYASRLLISMTWDGVLGPVGRPRARRRRPHPNGVPPRRELQRSLLVCL